MWPEVGEKLGVPLCGCRGCTQRCLMQWKAACIQTRHTIPDKHVKSTRHVTRYKACEQNMHALHTWNSSYSQWLFILPLPPWS